MRVRPPPPTLRPPRTHPPIGLPTPCAVLHDISQLLQTGLDRETLATLVGLTETGVNPEALAAVVKELRRESAALDVATRDAASDPPRPA